MQGGWRESLVRARCWIHTTYPPQPNPLHTQPPTVVCKMEARLECTIYTLHIVTFIFCTFGADFHAQSEELTNKICASELSRKSIKGALLVGHPTLSLFSSQSCFCLNSRRLLLRPQPSSPLLSPPSLRRGDVGKRLGFNSDGISRIRVPGNSTILLIHKALRTGKIPGFYIILLEYRVVELCTSREFEKKPYLGVVGGSLYRLAVK